MSRTVITHVRALDPETGLDVVCDIAMEDGVISAIGDTISTRPGDEVIRADGLAAIPGLIDMRVSVGEPGAEHRETLKSAGRAAAAGGVTTMVVMPTTDPVIDDVSLVEFIKRRGGERAKVRVLPAAALTKRLDGEIMTEIGLLSEAGAVLFSNGDASVADSLVMRRALAYASSFGAIVAHRPQDPFLSRGGVMHEGELSGRLGLPGMPAVAESIMVERDVALAALTGGRLLVDMISSAASLATIRRAKADGTQVFASASIHHLTLNELEVSDYRTFAKLAPPLRREDDRRALVDALADGALDFIVSGHEPRPPEDKRLPFEEAAFGASALETLLPAALTLHHQGEAALLDILAAMTIRPARLLGLPQGRLQKGAPADVVLVDLDAPFRFQADAMQSKCKNSPYDGRTMQGRVRRTFVGGVAIGETSPA